MLSIQVAGTEILTGSPRKFYAFVGAEYGIKSDYLNILAAHYNGSVIAADSVDSVLSLMTTKRLIPLMPALYVVRYDEAFLSSLDTVYASKLLSCNMIGTLVCVYELPKHASKLDKFFPDNTVALDPIAKELQFKYIRKQVNNVPDNLIRLIIDHSSSYGFARMVCYNLDAADSAMYRLSDPEILDCLSMQKPSTDALLRRGIASRNFKYLVSLLDKIDDLDNVFYLILSTLIELDKIQHNPRVDSDIRDMAPRWNHRSIYNMFTHTYQEILRIRTDTVDSRSQLLYLFGLMQFENIPEWEDDDL